MALITFLLMTAWTLLLVRLLAVGATLSDRTFLVYIGLGALMALSASPLAEKFIIPYPLNDYGFGYTGALFRVVVRNLTLLTPVVTYLLMRRNCRLISVADGFALAFAIGFGFEVSGAVLASSIASESLKGMTLLPPWQFTWDPNQRFPILGVSGDFAMAGVAYSVGLVALIFTAAVRFWRQTRRAFIVSASALLLVSAHEALWMNQILTSGNRLPTQGFAWFYDLIMVHGKLLALVALAALVYFTLQELRWIAASAGSPAPAVSKLIEECQALLAALFSGGPRGYLRASDQARRKRQLEIVTAEHARDRSDRQLFQSAQLLEIKIAQADSSAAENATGATRWSGPELRVAQAAWAVLVLIVVVMPWLPNWLAAFLWKFPLLNIPLVVVQWTILDVALVAALLWWFLQGPSEARAHWDPEEVFRFHGQNAISFASMGAALLILFQVPLNNFYPPYSTLSFFNRASFPQFDILQVPALLLLVALVTSALGLNPAARWRGEASAEQQRTAIVRKSIILANAMIFMWISVKIYVPMLAALQKAIGPTAYNVFGRFGNVVVALLTILFFFAVSLAIGYGLRRVSQRVEEFLLRGVSEDALRSASR
jgi:hypothetical protein